MLARTRPAVLVFALVAAPLTACSSGSDEAATNSSGSTNSGATGGAPGSGGTPGTSTADTTLESGGSSGGTSSGGSDSGPGGPNTTAANDGGASGSGGGSAGGAGTSSGLPYANVVAVSASGEDGNYTFAVSVESSDVDCSEFADWWEVVSEDGMLLYRRILEHSHTDENGTSDADAPGNTFTRSGGPVNVAADQVVIVRAHMNNLDEYHGVAMQGSVTHGFVAAADLDPAFARALESAAPQPETCLY